jgi:hypothetical protein
MNLDERAGQVEKNELHARAPSEDLGFSNKVGRKVDWCSGGQNAPGV